MSEVSPLDMTASQNETHTITPVALITGGSRGLGRSMVQNVARRGTDVIFTYQSREADARALVTEVEGIGRRAAALKLDVGNSGTFDAFVLEVQEVLQGWETDRFEFLVNNAGQSVGASLAETTEAQFDKGIDVHVKGPFFLTQKLLPLISDGGRIVNISTAVARHGVTFPGNAVYASAKGALEVLTRHMALELGPRGIAVNTVAPGGIATDFGDSMMRDPEMQKMTVSVTALGRMGQPEDVGGVVAALLAPEMGWVSGQRIEVSGGQNL